MNFHFLIPSIDSPLLIFYQFASSLPLFPFIRPFNNRLRKQDVKEVSGFPARPRLPRDNQSEMFEWT